MLQQYRLSADGIYAQLDALCGHLCLLLGVLALVLGKLAGEAAFGIVGAADKSAELADLEGQAAALAIGAGARVAVAVLREDVRPENLIECVEHFGDAQVSGLADGGIELLPELLEHLFPIEVTGGDPVELLLSIDTFPRIAQD